MVRATTATLLLLASLAPLAPSVASATPEPVVQRSVQEDEHVRIEELRVRGVNQRLVVRPKAASAPEFEILPAYPGRDAAQDRRSGGQRVWRLLSF